MDKKAVVQTVLQGKSPHPGSDRSTAFAPANIALCKYWGKRNRELNLPTTSSLSIALGERGATTTVFLSETADVIIVNNKTIALDTPFARKIIHFLDLFRTESVPYFGIETTSDIPIGAGLASSASGFAALVKALNTLFAWDLPTSALSILGRLGSGSASRSFWPGFVEWKHGMDENGMDSFGVPLDSTWSELCIGLLIIDAKEKAISSREGMQITVETSPFYKSWIQTQNDALRDLKQAIAFQDFMTFGETAESNAVGLHALMYSSVPPILYSTAKTIQAMKKIWAYREQGLSLFFTQDAGPNLKLLFLEKERAAVIDAFPDLQVIEPFQRAVT